MDPFHDRGGAAFAEDVDLAAVAATVGTPAFVYSRAALEGHVRALKEAFAGADPLVCYSVKANASLAVLDVIRRAGAGFDVVSGGELRRALRVGQDPKRIVFAGVGKTAREIGEALDAGILMFNVESEGELGRIDAIARERGTRADVALRVNPDVDPRTHTYISTGKRESKFGVDWISAHRLVDGMLGMKGVRLIGLHAHIGSQITEVGPYVEAAGKVIPFAVEVREAGHPVTLVNLGGGFGIPYGEKPALPFSVFGDVLVPRVKEAGLRLVLEPGRSVAGNAGVLLTRVEYVKESGDRRFVIVDAAMNDLLRPSLYGAHHRIWPAAAPFPEEEAAARDGEMITSDVVGPVCETGDFLAKDRRLPPVREGDLLVVYGAGAYGREMSSNYNSRPRAPEVLVHGDRWTVVRERETFEDLVRGERIPGED